MGIVAPADPNFKKLGGHFQLFRCFYPLQWIERKKKTCIRRTIGYKQSLNSKTVPKSDPLTDFWDFEM